MREFELIIDEALRNGLTPFRVTPFNSQLLDECLGFRLGKAGLEKYELKENPLPSTIDMHYYWPFPQFIVGECYNFLVVRDLTHDYVYAISDDMLTVSFVDSMANDGTLMEVADFGEYAFMTNGTVMIYWDTTTNDWHKITSSPTIPMMRTVCNFKGQAVGGNIVDDWYDCDNTFYVWSKIGSIEFTPNERNESGYRRCPFGGIVHHVRRLGNVVVGYSSEGVTFLSPAQSPATTFGFIELSDVGIINQGAMNGDLNRQVYVGEDYILREVTKEGIKELGYEVYMEQLVNGDVIVGYDKKLKDFYIGDGTKTFLLSPKGLTEIPQHPSAVWRLNKGTYILPGTQNDYEPLIVSCPFDMGYRGQKTITSIESDIFPALNAEAAIDYYDDPSSRHTSNYKPLNNQGICSITVSGNTFRFRLKSNPDHDDLRIGYIKARYKMTDLRGIRGVYAPPPRGQ